MARMRSLKPEFWHDQEITRLPRDARLLYMAMWNLADEHARLQGDPRYLKGQAFPYDDDLTAPAIDALVDKLVEMGKARRYTVRGAVYLLLPKLSKHQRLDTEKVPSRLPSPDEAEPGSKIFTPVPEPDPNESGKKPDQGADESALSMWHVAGGREHDSTTSDAPSAPRTDLAVIEGTAPTAQTIVAAWVDWLQQRPPSNVVGQVAKHVGQMLAEGIDPADIRRGLGLWSDKGLHPSTLPSVVNEVMNAPRSGRSRQQSETDAQFERAAQRLGVVK